MIYGRKQLVTGEEQKEVREEFPAGGIKFDYFQEYTYILNHSDVDMTSRVDEDEEEYESQRI